MWIELASSQRAMVVTPTQHECEEKKRKEKGRDEESRMEEKKRKAVELDWLQDQPNSRLGQETCKSFND